MVVYRDENSHGYIMSLGEYYGIWGERDLFNSHSRVWMINAGAPSITT